MPKRWVIQIFTKIGKFESRLIKFHFNLNLIKMDVILNGQMMTCPFPLDLGVVLLELHVLKQRKTLQQLFENLVGLSEIKKTDTTTEINLLPEITALHEDMISHEFTSHPPEVTSLHEEKIIPPPESTSQPHEVTSISIPDVTSLHEEKIIPPESTSQPSEISSIPEIIPPKFTTAPSGITSIAEEKITPHEHFTSSEVIPCQITTPKRLHLHLLPKTQQPILPTEKEIVPSVPSVPSVPVVDPKRYLKTTLIKVNGKEYLIDDHGLLFENDENTNIVGYRSENNVYQWFRPGFGKIQIEMSRVIHS